MIMVSLVILLSQECHWTLLMISQVNTDSGNGLVPAMQQAITGANFDSDLCYHMASLGHNELMMSSGRQTWEAIIDTMIVTENWRKKKGYHSSVSTVLVDGLEPQGARTPAGICINI